MDMYRNYDEDKLMDSDSYGDHVHAMTSEGLHSKAEIADELAVRDDRIKELETALVKIRASANFAVGHVDGDV